MALSKGRIHHQGETQYPWERDAIDFVLDNLPDYDPYQAWPLVELAEPTTGRLYEIDLLLLGKHALYLVEIKSHPGVVTGDSRDWTITHDGRRKHIDNPLPATNRKAKVLASLLKRELDSEHSVYVEPLVFLSHENVRLQLADSGRNHVLDRANVIRALTHAEYAGSKGLNAGFINKPTMRAVVAALRKIGVRESRAARVVGEYKLGALLAEGPGYQEHRGEHVSVPGFPPVRIRSYLVPRGRSVEAQARLSRASLNEASILGKLGEHPRILRCTGYNEHGPLGPALLFEPFDPSESLESFVRRQPALSFDDRLEILQQIAEALHYCHRNQILHRNLSPSSVLVTAHPDGELQVRLHSFQLALEQEGGIGTRHLTDLSEDAGLLYRAPEVLEDPMKATVESDIFSLGAVAYFVLTGQAPAASLVEREAMIIKQEGLRIGAVRDDVSPGMDDAVALATEYGPVNRPDNAIVWLNVLLDEVTRPDVAPREELDPHKAKPNSELTGGLKVLAELGEGATSRVLKVASGERVYALKIPHDDGCAERVRSEAEVLKEHRHQHIVGCHGLRRIGSRDCLLLDFVGSNDQEDAQNLADLLRREGTVGLDYARRYGDDLLSAVQYLEEHGIQHRDIKPANIGFTPSTKRARHLVLIDFSLSAVDPTNVTVGTPVYRDPYLRMRGSWDFAADRYSVALVLYEMLTGGRPAMDEPAHGMPELRIDAERFDATLRDRFLSFFTRAFSSRVEERFSSAEHMKTAWLALFFDAPAQAHAPGADAREPLIVELDTVTLQTPIEALALSARAKNALDRTGVATVAELLQLPRNYLSAVRGIGRRVAQEIQATADALHERFSVPDVAAFAPRYLGPKLMLGPQLDLGLDIDPLYRLRDAGIATTSELAAASQQRVLRILGKEIAEQVRTKLDAGQALEDEPSLERWAQQFLNVSGHKASRTDEQVQALLGLHPLGRAEAPGDSAPDIARVAMALGVTRQAVHATVQKARERWELTPGLDSLCDAAAETVSGLGGVATISEAAAELARQWGNGGEPDAAQVKKAAALLRVVSEVQGDSAPLIPGRIRGQLWLALEPEHLEAARKLGRVADELAAAEPLPSTEKVKAALLQCAQATPMATLSLERLVAVAARASERAACSARLELYPRGMSAERALILSAVVLRLPEIDEPELIKRVAARYPEAQPLPGRPALDELLAIRGMIFDSEAGKFRRRHQTSPTSSGSLIPVRRYRTALPHQSPLRTPEAMEAAAFDESLRAGVEGGRFRVVQINSRDAEEAGLLLADKLGVRPTSLDGMLWQHLEAKRAEAEVDLAAVLEADRMGPKGPHWGLLRDLVREAARELVAEILSQRDKPWLLVHPGAFATYQLMGELQELIDRAEREEGAAVVLVVASNEDGAAPSINSRMPVPAPLPGQRLRIPRSWMDNAHRAAADAGGNG